MGIQLRTPQSISENKKSVIQCIIGIPYDETVWERTITETTAQFTVQETVLPENNSETPYVECYKPRQRDMWNISSSHEFGSEYSVKHAGILCLGDRVTTKHEDDARKAVETAMNVIME